MEITWSTTKSEASRGLSGDLTTRDTKIRGIWDEDIAKSLVFLHGANVNGEQAEVWGDIFFKRMWISGIHADFYNVDWRVGNIDFCVSPKPGGSRLSRPLAFSPA